MPGREWADEASLRERVRLLTGDRFDVIRPLGEGGFGSVVEVYDRRTDARMALKVLRATRAVDVFAFKSEFRSLSGVKHRNLVTLYELFTHLDYWGFTMELVEGDSIMAHVAPNADEARLEQETVRMTPHASPVRSVAAPRRGVDFDVLRSLFAQLTVALCEMHAMGYVHRDIKPANILVEPGGRLVVLDFGLVGQSARDAREVVGTPPYMAPELLIGEDPTPAADWYAVGAVLFQCLTGRLPSSGARPPTSVPDDLRLLCGALLNDDPGRRATGRDVAEVFGVSVRSAPSVFVGRTHELERLEAALETVRQGVFAGVEISGPAGVGKTQLCERFLSGVDALVLRTQCHPSESVPYKSLDGMIDNLASALFRTEGDHASLPPEMPYVVQAFPIFKILTENRPSVLAQQLGGHAMHRRRMAAQGLRRIVERVARTRPLVLFIDDLHWGDGDSIRIFERLLAPPVPPVLLLVTHRPQTQNSTLARAIEVLRDAEPSRWCSLELGPLSANDIGQLAAHSGRNLESNAVRELLQQSQGNPFLLGEILRGAESSTDNLPTLARNVLRNVCVAGRPIALRHVCPPQWAREQVVDAVAHLRSRRLLREGPLDELAALDTYHARVREIVLAELNADELIHHNLTLAESLTAAGAAPREIALHWHRAGRADEAATTAEAAGDAAVDALAFEQAAEMYALAKASRPSVGVSLKLAHALADAGRGGDAADEFRQAASRTGDADALRLAAEHDLRSGYIERGMETLAHVLARHGATIPSSPVAAIPRLTVSLIRRVTDRVAGRVRKQTRAELDAHWTATVGLGLVDPVRAAPFAAEAHRLAKLLGDEHALARSTLMEVGFLASAGRHQLAQVLLERGRRLPVVAREPWLQGLALTMQAVAAYERGRWRETYESSVRAETVFQQECTGVAWELRSVQLFALSSLFFLGDLTALQKSVRESLVDAEDRGDLYAATNIRTQLVPSIHLAADRPDLAHAEIDTAIADWGEDFSLQHNYALGTKTITDLYEGEPIRALRRLQRQRRPQAMSMMSLDHSVRTYWAFLRGVTELAAMRAGARVPFGCERALFAAQRLHARGRSPYRGWAAVLRAGVAGVRQQDPCPQLRVAIRCFQEGEMSLYRDCAELWLVVEQGRSDGEVQRRIAQRNVVNPRRVARSLIGCGVL